ncbi:MAG: hypothetical protein KGI02_09135 [Thaumarchaeota archaeon]|nr:hypothetical protein [Nitrososphaerota archaeon]
MPQTVTAQKTLHDISQSDNMQVTNISNDGAALVINQVIDKLQFKMGEPIVVHPEMSSIENGSVFVAISVYVMRFRK